MFTTTNSVRPDLDLARGSLKSRVSYRSFVYNSIHRDFSALEIVQTEVGKEDSFPREFSAVHTFARRPIKFAKLPIFEKNLENREGGKNPVFQRGK